MLIDRQCLALAVARDELELTIGHAGMAGQPSNGLMAERVRRGFDAGGLGVVLDDLLDVPGRERAGKPGLE